MKISFLGGADEVGASSILIEIGGRRLLIDAGIRPSPKTYWELAGDQLPDLGLIDRVGGLDAILVTHAHTDHTGALELVCERYPHVPVYATEVTIALTRVLHADARRIMLAKRDAEGELPLFDEVAVERLMESFAPVTFRQRVTLAPGLAATFFPAGHIAGAAMIGLESAEGRVLITGDISITSQRTVDGARTPAFSPDVVIMESTYGGRLHANRVAEERRLVTTITEVTEAGGKVLIPAFALGRSQELLLLLAEFQRRGELAPIPIWADGMVRAICQAYASFPEALPAALQARDAQFFNDAIRPIERATQRNDLLWQPGPLVIVSSSGMLAGGPSLHYARGLVGHAQHAILLTGYQDEESPGRRLQEVASRGHGTLQLGQERVPVRCRLGTYALSAHADEGQMVSLVEALDPAQVFLVHGSEGARLSLAHALRSRGRLVHQPRAGQTFELHFRPTVTAAAPRGIGAARPLHLRRLWEAITQAADAEMLRSPFYVTQDELAAVWWGENPAPQHLQTLNMALAQDNIYFVADPAQAQVFRVRPAAQVQLQERRREQMAIYAHAADQWLLIQAPDGQAAMVRCVTCAADHLQVAALPADDARWNDDHELHTVWPEDVLGLLGPGDADGKPNPATEVVAQLINKLPRLPQDVTMEPNQVMMFARQQFPPAARLRKIGYRLAERVLVLTFDFPDMATVAFADVIRETEDKSGWVVEVTAEANQGALGTLVNEMLPTGWKVKKGPSIHREERRIAATVLPDAEAASDVLADLCARYVETTGYTLDITLMAPPVSAPAPEVSQPAQKAAAPMEINAAYAIIRAALADSTLYRVGLRDKPATGIMLSFISAVVGERYREQINELEQRCGWQIVINPQANQAAILDIAQRLLTREGATAVKGPSIHPSHCVVRVNLQETLTGESRRRLLKTFEEETGFQFWLTMPRLDPHPAPESRPVANVLLLAPGLIHLNAIQQGVILNPEKLNRTIERIRRLGIRPPLQVRRTRFGYALVDGLYRLRAAQSLGLEKVPTEVVEGSQ